MLAKSFEQTNTCTLTIGGRFWHYLFRPVPTRPSEVPEFLRQDVGIDGGARLPDLQDTGGRSFNHVATAASLRAR